MKQGVGHQSTPLPLIRFSLHLILNSLYKSIQIAVILCPLSQSSVSSTLIFFRKGSNLFWRDF